MIIKKDKFIDEYTEWVRRKLKEALPEEDFEDSMLEIAKQTLLTHVSIVSEIFKRPENG